MKNVKSIQKLHTFTGEFRKKEEKWKLLPHSPLVVAILQIHRQIWLNNNVFSIITNILGDYS